MSDAAEHIPKRNPAKPIAIGVIILLIIFTIFYALSDRLPPGTSRGIVSAHVVQIAPRVSGDVTEVMVDDDAVVQVGNPLFSIDARPFELALRQAEASLATTVEGINASSASLVAAQAAVTQARTALDTAQADADRASQLEKRGITSKAQ